MSGPGGGGPSGPAPLGVRFDHLILATSALDEAAEAYRRLGFVVEPGGEHPGRGTRNGLIRFPDGYLELLEVHDPAEARASGPTGAALVALLASRRHALATFAISTTALDEAVVALRGARFDVGEPRAASRRRPDGAVLRWQTAAPGGSTVATPWPFLIEWGSERATIERTPPAHPNGAVGIRSLTLRAAPGAPIERFYAALGLAGDPLVAGSTTLEYLGARAAVGPTGFAVAVGDLDRLARELAGRGVPTVRLAPGTLDLAEPDAAVAGLVFAAAERELPR